MIVLAVGMPRAGSGWHYNLTHDLMVAAGAADARDVRARYGLESVLTAVNCNLGVLSLRRLGLVVLRIRGRETVTLKLHAGPTVWGRLLIRSGKMKATYIYRDPRDALVSAYEYGERARAVGRENVFSPLRTIEEAIDFMAEYVDYWRAWTRVPGVHILRYEDFKRDYEGEARRLARFLGVDPAVEAAAAAIRRYRPEAAGPQAAGLHFVKGVSGRYREILSPEQQEMCLARFGEALRGMGYADPGDP